jgi:hypothetical protein
MPPLALSKTKPRGYSFRGFVVPDSAGYGAISAKTAPAE